MKNNGNPYQVHFEYLHRNYFENICYSDNEDFGVIERVLNYIWKEDNTKPCYCGRRGVIDEFDPKLTAMQFYFVQKVFNKNLGERFAHMVISFGAETGLDPFTVTEIANRIADFIGQKFQTAFGVHIYR